MRILRIRRGFTTNSSGANEWVAGPGSSGGARSASLPGAGGANFLGTSGATPAASSAGAPVVTSSAGALSSSTAAASPLPAPRGATARPCSAAYRTTTTMSCTSRGATTHWGTIR